MADDEPQEVTITIEAAQRAGVWANFARVSHSPHEFTIDFVRLEPQGNEGIVVARVSVSPRFVVELINALQGNWEKYAKKAMPQDPTEYERRTGNDDKA